MKKTLPLLVILGITLFMSGCAQKVTIKALEPAEVDRAAQTKKVSIAPFKNDRIGLSTKIEANLAKHRLDNKKYFTIVSRSDFDRIIREQKIQNSGLIDESTAVEVGSLIGAEAIISGNVGKVTSTDTRFYEERVRCGDEKCKTLVRYRVGCTKRAVGLSAEIRMVDVVHGDIIYADTMSKSRVYKHCRDDSRALPSREMAAQNMAHAIADSFTFKLTPHYRRFEVTLLEDPDLDYNDRQEQLLEVSLEYIKQGRYDKAERFLFDLIDSTEQQSYVAFYNLGVIKEAEGNYKDAKEYYEAADNLMLKPVEEISSAYVRINTLIEKRDRAYSQMAKDGGSQ